MRALTVGTLTEYPSESAARKSPEVQATILRLNATTPTAPPTTVGALIARYEKEEMPSRYSTRASYQSFIENHIRPRWEGVLLTDVVTGRDIPPHSKRFFPD